jgi:hypothetical protein
MLLRLPDPLLVGFDYHNDRSKSSLEQPSLEGFLFMTRPRLVREGRALMALEPGSRSCTWQSKQPIPTDREQLPGGLGMRLMTREPLLRYALDRC